MDSTQDAATRLALVVTDLHRSVDRTVARTYAHPKPPETHLAVLRHVRAHDGATVGQAAEALHMHPNNASAAATQLVATGLLERSRDAEDRRVSHLHLTAVARTRLDEVDVIAGRVVATGLDRLAPEQTAALERALDALEALHRALA